MPTKTSPCAPLYVPDYSKPVVLWEVLGGELRPVARSTYIDDFFADFRRDAAVALERDGVLLRVSLQLEANVARVRLIVRRAAQRADYWHKLPSRAEVGREAME